MTLRRTIRQTYHDLGVQPRIPSQLLDLRRVQLRVGAVHHQGPESDRDREHRRRCEHAHRQRVASRPADDPPPRRALLPDPRHRVRGALADVTTVPNVATAFVEMRANEVGPALPAAVWRFVSPRRVRVARRGTTRSSTSRKKHAQAWDRYDSVSHVQNVTARRRPTRRSSTQRERYRARFSRVSVSVIPVSGSGARGAKGSAPTSRPRTPVPPRAESSHPPSRPW